MPTVTIDLPEDAFAALRCSPEEFARELRLAAAIFWYSRYRVSQGMASEIAGVSRAEFLDALGRAKVPAVQVDGDELREEVESALQAHRGRVAADLPVESGSA